MSIRKVMYVSLFVVIIALVISGCGGNQSTIGSADAPKVIQTYGEAELTAPPELAKVSLAIETRSKRAEDAVEENAQRAAAVHEALLDFGLAEEDIITGSYRLYSYREWFEERPAAEEELQTFQAVNEIIISTTKLENIGELIDAAVRAGANNINYISFELNDPQEMLMLALQTATEQAAKKADAIAKGSGEKVSGLYSIREERADYIPYRLQDDMIQEEMAMDSASTPINPDEVTVRATVVAEFSF